MGADKTGGPAFPVQDASAWQAHGLTVRDYFAATAMQIMWDAYDKGYCGLNNNDEPNFEIIAGGAYHLADAMLRAREAKP